MWYELNAAVPLEWFRRTVATMARSLSLSWRSEFAIDLGTSNTLIYVPGRGIMLNEPSIIAFEQHGYQLVAAGRLAKQMIGRAPRSLCVMRPLQAGVIADDAATEMLLAAFIRRALGHKPWLPPKVLICVPAEITEVERHAIENVVQRAGAREVGLVEKPFAAALGARLDLAANHASMLVNIGGGTTDVAVLSFGGLGHATTVRVGGLQLDQAIAHHLYRTHKVEIGENTAEFIKLKLAAATEAAEQQVLRIGDPSLNTRLPVWLNVTGAEIHTAIEGVVLELLSAVRNTLEELPPEVAADLLEMGIVLTGGGAQLPGLSERLSQAVGLEVRLADSPTLAAAFGAGQMLQPAAQLPEMKPADQTMPGMD